MGLGRGGSDLHSTHYLHIPLSWTGKRGGGPGSSFQNNGALKIVLFTKTEAGGAMAEAHLPNCGYEGEAKDCWIHSSGVFDGRPFDQTFRVEMRL